MDRLPVGLYAEDSDPETGAPGELPRRRSATSRYSMPLLPELAHSRRIGSTRLDRAFTDLKRDQDGLARVELRDPDHGMQVSLWVDRSYPYLMLFSGDALPNVNRGSLAVEPMTCPPNAFQTALIRLEPGSSYTSTWGISGQPGQISSEYLVI